VWDTLGWCLIHTAIALRCHEILMVEYIGDSQLVTAPLQT